ncbi:plasmid mobilization protein [Azospirillum himalayense]|uniref:Plasmid mobilization relaxosome protein MobC n=1 Tax=Azospirillum himalayense TaxID=654847 RepID=A0ABW0GAC3_9PROT
MPDTAIVTHDAPARRRGTETRQRRLQVLVRLDEAEERLLGERAASAGLTPSDYLRQAALGPVARVRLPPPDPRVESLQRLLGELGRVGNNVNQIARALNVALKAGETPAPDGAAIADAAVAIKRIEREILATLGVEEMQPA